MSRSPCLTSAHMSCILGCRQGGSRRYCSRNASVHTRRCHKDRGGIGEVLCSFCLIVTEKKNVSPTFVRKGAHMSLACVFTLSRGPEHHAAFLTTYERCGAGGFSIHWRPDQLLVKKQVLFQNLRLPPREVFFRTHTLFSSLFCNCGRT